MDPSLALDLKQDIESECSKLGTVNSIQLFEVGFFECKEREREGESKSMFLFMFMFIDVGILVSRALLKVP